MIQVCERRHECYRPSGDPAVLHVIGVVAGHSDRDRKRRADEISVRDEEDRPDISYHEDTEDLQAGEAHNRTENLGADTAAQVGDEDAIMADIMFGSYKELGLLMLVVIFSVLGYTGEKGEDGTMFDSMPTVCSNTIQIPVIEMEELAEFQPILDQDQSQSIICILSG